MCPPSSCLSAIDLETVISLEIFTTIYLAFLAAMETQCTQRSAEGISRALWRRPWGSGVSVHSFSLTSPNYKCLPAVFAVLRAGWFNQQPDWWIDYRNQLQITLTSPSLRADWLKWSQPLHCLNANLHSVLLLALTPKHCVRSVDSSKALSASAQHRSGVGWERKPAGSELRNKDITLI